MIGRTAEHKETGHRRACGAAQTNLHPVPERKPPNRGNLVPKVGQHGRGRLVADVQIEADLLFFHAGDD